MVLLLDTVERVRNVAPEARSRNTTALYSGLISVFIRASLVADGVNKNYSTACRRAITQRKLKTTRTRRSAAHCSPVLLPGSSTSSKPPLLLSQLNRTLECFAQNL